MDGILSGDSNFILAVAIEAVALCLFVILILAYKNRRLKSLLKKLQARMEELVSQLKNRAPPPPPPTPQQESYVDKISRQIEATKDHHYSLGTRQDISLDLDPDAPLPRRAAAIRYTMLIAEKEATYDNEKEPNWDLLATRYQQLFSFHEDYAQDKDSNADLDHEDLQEELLQAKKRINNLERFKVLYFELEENWERCKGEAQEQYSEIQTIVSEQQNSEDLQRKLEKYHTTYSELGDIIEQEFEEKDYDPADREAHLIEIKRLRSVANDQQKIISQLENQLESASTKEEQHQVMQGLQQELSKQERFLQESETCIKLMEDELSTANHEIEQLRSRVYQMPELKERVKDLQRESDKNEQIINALKTENRRLAKKLKLTQEAPPEDNAETRRIRKELSTLQGKYNDLEEKYLDLKIKN